MKHKSTTDVLDAFLISSGDNHSIFSRMLGALKIMHDKNPSWGPLFVTQPSNVYRHLVYPFLFPTPENQK
jgi:hypothetical protein